MSRCIRILGGSDAYQSHESPNLRRQEPGAKLPQPVPQYRGYRSRSIYIYILNLFFKPCAAHRQMNQSNFRIYASAYDVRKLYRNCIPSTKSNDATIWLVLRAVPFIYGTMHGLKQLVSKTSRVSVFKLPVDRKLI